MKWLDDGLSQPGKSNSELARRLGIPQSRVSEMRNGKRKPQPDELRVIAEYVERPLPSELVPQRLQMVPIKGYVGAGSEAHYYKDADDPNDDAPMPPGGNADTVAVEIRGTSLGSMFDRWLVYYDEIRTPPTPGMFRRLCVVGLPDGRVLVKRIIPATKTGHFHLESQTEGIMEDQVIEWAALVRAMAPK